MQRNMLNGNMCRLDFDISQQPVARSDAIDAHCTVLKH